MKTAEDEEFERIEREIARRAQQDDDTMCYQSELNAAVLAEREACAKVSEEYDDEYDVHTKQTKQGITDSIRART